MFSGMPSMNTAKKQPADTPVGTDWHRADIVAALKKSGWSLRSLAIHNKYKPNTLQNALRYPWPKAERIIAAAIGVRPEQIWPSRYSDKTTGQSTARAARG